METAKAGKSMAWSGVAVAFVINFIGLWYLQFISLTLIIIGCILWSLGKNRSWAFGFWGFIAPIGFLGISLLKDKSVEVAK